MALYLILLVPIISALVCSVVPAFRHRIVWWEMLLPVAAWLVCAVPTIVISKNSMTSDTQFFTWVVEEARHYEDWNETVPCSHPRYVSDGKGGMRYAGQMHAFDVQYHPERWAVLSSSGNELDVKSYQYRYFVERWGKQKFRDLHRSHYTDDGDLYFVGWPGTDALLEPCTEVGTYENRVQASETSVFHHRQLTPDEEKLVYGYPEMWKVYRSHSALGASEAVDERLTFWNAKLGAKKWVRIWLLVFDSPDRQLGLLQEAHWQGGNKNEVVICIGIQGDKPSWTHVFSWTEVEEVKVELRDLAYAKGPTVEFVDQAAKIVHDKYEMVDWNKFDYLEIDPPLWAVILAFFLTLLTSAGCLVWAIHNEHQNHSYRSWSL